MKDLTPIISDLLQSLGVTHKGITTGEIAGQAIVTIDVEDATPWKAQRGESIRALDHVVKKIAEAQSPLGSVSEERMALIDVAGYRAELIKELQDKARMMAERAKAFKYDVELSPMTAYERLIIHSTLQGVPGIKTESRGEGRDRRVVIKYII
ncbi:hypothetical protein EBR66_01945 [bacterium]|nr:hypothetical protein [bacterium]